MERIGPYQVMGEIGRGGMGVVLRGLDPAIGRQVAIKVILLQEFSDPEERELLRARLYREAQAAGVLNHPGIVTVYYVGEEGETAFIAMEYVGGATLEKALTAQPPPSREVVCRVLRQTAAALDYAHGKGVIHRDIKPANIMLDEKGDAKICDFGIAKGLVGQTSLTRTGMSLGSPFYMSPEQIRGDSVDGSTDQYSLGVVAYQIFTGQRPFQADTIQTLFFRIMSTPPSPAHEKNPALSPEVNQVLQRALAKEPAARYASCNEFVETLLEKLAGVGSSSPAPGKAPISQTSRKWVPVAVAVLLGLAGAVGYAVWPKHAVPPQHTSKEEAGQKAPAPPLPVVERFTVAPATIALGKSATLSWSVKNAVEVRIEPGIGVVGAAGTCSVAPKIGTTYELLAKSPNGSPDHPSIVSLTVERPAVPVIEDFSASPSTIQSGQPAMLRWRVRNATEVSIPGIGPQRPQSSQPVFPTESRTYVLEAKGQGGSVSRSAAVSVTIPAGAPPNIVAFSGDPVTINAGEAAVLRWQATNASKVRIDHGIGGVDASGVLRVFPEATTTYKLFASNNRGTFNRLVKIIVTK
jgi:tRNA A-37 threonylcarbamoyl transferase component Bud32